MLSGDPNAGRASNEDGQRLATANAATFLSSGSDRFGLFSTPGYFQARRHSKVRNSIAQSPWNLLHRSSGLFSEFPLGSFRADYYRS